MNFLRSPRNKLLLAAGAIVALALLAPTQGVSASTAARVLIGIAAIAGLAWWFARAKQPGTPLVPAPRLQVLARTGLSQRCGMALVEADGRNYLVVYGDGFAELQEAHVSFPVSKALAQNGGAR